jgi:O-6-methylguanine DNA methyltransferase
MKKLQKKSLISLKKLTDFQCKVYWYTLHIPVGKTRTYKRVAEAIGHPGAFRAVGSALRKTPYPFLIPCHRVIRSDGKSGNYVYGRKLKKKLLAAEKEFVSKSG